MTPHQIAAFLTPWVLGLMAYALLFIGVRRMFAISGRVGAVFVVGRCSVTAKDTAQAALIGLAAMGLVHEITRLSPDPQWWSQPLNSGWEISSGTMGVLVLAAEPLLALLAAWAFIACTLIVTTWLCSPADADHPDSPTRWQQIRTLVASIWQTYRLRRTHTVNADGRA